MLVASIHAASRKPSAGAWLMSGAATARCAVISFIPSKPPNYDDGGSVPTNCRQPWHAGIAGLQRRRLSAARFGLGGGAHVFFRQVVNLADHHTGPTLLNAGAVKSGAVSRGDARRVHGILDGLRGRETPPESCLKPGLALANWRSM